MNSMNKLTAIAGRARPERDKQIRLPMVIIYDILMKTGMPFFLSNIWILKTWPTYMSIYSLITHARTFLYDTAEHETKKLLVHLSLVKLLNDLRFEWILLILSTIR